MSHNSAAGARLKSVRVGLGKELADVAKELGIPLPHLLALELGKIPSALELVRLCQYYGVSVSFVVRGKLNMTPIQALQAMDEGEITEWQFMEVLGTDDRIAARIEAEKMRTKL